MRLIPFVSPPTATNAGSDTILTLEAEGAKGLVQNNTSANCYLNWDAPAAPGNLVVPPGYAYEFTQFSDTIHLYTAVAQNINGAAAGNLVVLVWV